jgi:hypothetical protein
VNRPVTLLGRRVEDVLLPGPARYWNFSGETP